MLEELKKPKKIQHNESTDEEELLEEMSNEQKEQSEKETEEIEMENEHFSYSHKSHAYSYRLVLKKDAAQNRAINEYINEERITEYEKEQIKEHIRELLLKKKDRSLNIPQLQKWNGAK